MKNLCLIFDSAPRYREEIYREMDSNFSCNWYIGEYNTDIKEMDLGLLKSVRRYKIIGNINRLYWQRGIIKLLFHADNDTFLVGGESRAISKYIFILLAKLFRPRKKVYLWSHGIYNHENKFVKLLKTIMFKCSTGSFLYGNYSRDLMIKDGFDAKKLYVIHNSLHYNQQIKLRENMIHTCIYSNHFKNNLPVICFIGRLTPVKRLDLLINALAVLNRKCGRFNLVFIGDGSERENLEKLAEKLDLKKYIWFYGACYDEKTNAELIYNADLTVAPGNVGLTAMHSMMFGTPVISHNCFSMQMPEFESIIPGRTGDFFEYSDPSDLSRVIDNWFNLNGTKREEVRRGCYKEIDTSWNPNFQMKVLKDALI